MILLWWSTWSSGWAASIHSSASVTTSFGSLISFFMGTSRLAAVDGRVGSGWAVGADRRGLGVSQVDARYGPAVGRRPGQETVEQGGQRAREELGHQVDGQLLPLHGAAGQLLHEHGADSAGRVD